MHQHQHIHGGIARVQQRLPQVCRRGLLLFQHDDAVVMAPGLQPYRGSGIGLTGSIQRARRPLGQINAADAAVVFQKND